MRATPESSAPYPEIARIVLRGVQGYWDSVILDATVGSDRGGFAIAVVSGSEVRSEPVRETTRLLELLQRLRASTAGPTPDGVTEWTTARITFKRDGTFDAEVGYEAP